MILQLWPYVGEYARNFLREVIEPQVKAQLPGPFKSFKFLQMDMGDIPCRVGGIKVNSFYGLILFSLKYILYTYIVGELS